MKKEIIALILLIGYCHALTSPDISFKDRLEIGSSSGFTYPTGLTWDGERYYSINGGNAEDGKIAVYTKEGIFQKSIETKIDSRGIQAVAGKIYVKDYENRIYELKKDSLEKIGEYEFQSQSSKIVITPDGRYMFDHYRGKIVRYSFPEGEKIEEIGLEPGLDSYDLARAFQIATDGAYLYFITGPKIYYYTFSGALIGTETLEKGPETDPTLDEWSLSYAKERIWVYRCVQAAGICSEDNWYGYRIDTPPIGESPQATGAAGGTGGGAIGGIIVEDAGTEEISGKTVEKPEETIQTIEQEKQKETTEEKIEESISVQEKKETSDVYLALLLGIGLLAVFVFTVLKGQDSRKQKNQKQHQKVSGSKKRT